MVDEVKRREYRKNWRKAHRGKIAAYRNKWRSENKERHKEQTRMATKVWRENNPDYAEIESERKRRQRIERSDFINSYKSSNSCIRCGNSDIRVLQFHHRDRLVKKYNISAMVSRCLSFETIQAEMQKCDILCANCHIIVECELKQ